MTLLLFTRNDYLQNLYSTLKGDMTVIGKLKRHYPRLHFDAITLLIFLSNWRIQKLLPIVVPLSLPLKSLVEKNWSLYQELVTTGYSPGQRLLTPRQVRSIVEYLEEPWGYGFLDIFSNSSNSAFILLAIRLTLFDISLSFITSSTQSLI